MYRIFFFAGFVEILTFRFYAECKNPKNPPKKRPLRSQFYGPLRFSLIRKRGCMLTYEIRFLLACVL